MAWDDQQPLESYLPTFGLSSFRPGQREVIETILAGHDCLCVMPTGGGKSLCYQLPAIARPGITLVVSPLIALMKDQVDQLQALGLPASFINSMLSPEEQGARLADLVQGRYRLMYVAPERFRSPRFVNALRAAQLNLLAIDEAHCVSEWGHDFRPDYARLGKFRAEVGHPPTVALTATATRAVRQDIMESLGLRDPRSYVTGFARPNLHYEVRQPGSAREKEEVLLDFLSRQRGTGIIYASSRKRCEEVAGLIEARTQRSVVVYHAGLLPEDRREAQDRFMSGACEIVVATLAFGMGIDKADVRFVVHYNLPGSLEAYYQEAGRAGRDGKPAACLLLASSGDRFIHEFFIKSAYPDREVIEQVYDFLCEQETDQLEMTLQEIKETLRLDIAAEGVGACEKLLEKAGVLERLEAVENHAAIKIDSELSTLVDLLPRAARKRRRVLQVAEEIVGDQRRQWVFFPIRVLLAKTELEPPALNKALRELTSLDCFAYQPPFRGRALRLLDRETPFDELPLDLEQSERRKEIEFERLRVMIDYSKTPGCRQSQILAYFGETEKVSCGHCDNCDQSSSAAPAGVGSTQQPSEVSSSLTAVVQMALAGVARGRGRYGKTLIAGMLCGSQAEKVRRSGLGKLSTFGLLSFLKQDEVGQILESLLQVNCAEQVETERFRPLIQLTPFGNEVMQGKRSLPTLQLPKALTDKISRIKIGGATAQATTPAQEVRVDPPRPQLEPPSRSSEAARLAARVSLPAEAATTLTQQPSHYWTWRMLSAGFTPQECALARGIGLKQVFEQACRAADEGWPVQRKWFVSNEVARSLENLAEQAAELNWDSLARRLPRGIEDEQLQWFVKCPRGTSV